MSKRVRIKDIAAKAGVSTGTVDRVIHKRGNVAPEVKAKILKVMEELNFKRNVLASALAFNRNITIGTLLPHPQQDSFWAQVQTGVEKALESIADYGVSVEHFFFDYFDPMHFERVSRSIQNSNIDAVLLAPVFSKEGNILLDELAQSNIPTVLINTYIARPEANCLAYVGQDSYQSGIVAAKMLDFALNKGETVMIMHLEKGVANAYHLLDKERGFKDYFAKVGIKNIHLVRSEFEHVEKYDLLQAFFKKQFEQYPETKAVFVSTSRLHTVAKYLQLQGRHDIKLLGFDLIADNLKYLRSNQIDFLINQNPMKQGFLGIINIFKAMVMKEEVEKLQYLTLDIVMAENLEYYLKEEQNFQAIF